MDAILFTLSLEVVLLQMRILEGSTELRLGGWQPVSKLEKLQRDKLLRNRQAVNDIIRKTLIELVECGENYTLENAVDLLQGRESAVSYLTSSHEQLKSSRDTIILELDSKRHLWTKELGDADQKMALLRDKMSTKELSDADQKMALLRDKMSDDILNATTRLGYAEKWLFARAESLDLQFDEPRAPVPRSDFEDRVHEELLKAYELQIKEREVSLEYWKERYTSDIATISSQVAVKCDQLRAANSRRTELQKLYDLHAGEIRSWLTFKRERAARLAREEYHRASATRIQAWWRGVMVRRALGAFKYLRTAKKSAAKGKKK